MRLFENTWENKVTRRPQRKYFADSEKAAEHADQLRNGEYKLHVMTWPDENVPTTPEALADWLNRNAL